MYKWVHNNDMICKIAKFFWLYLRLLKCIKI